MAIFPRDIFTALKAALIAAPALSYVDTVAIRQYRPNQLPDFTNYCIVISPEAATPETYAVGQKWIRYEITLVCLLKVNYTLEDAVMADSTGSSPPFRLVGDEAREDFIVEGRIHYTPYGQRFISPTT
jgi:hypothetical protein